MANRKRIKDVPVLKSWDDVDLTLKEIAECELAIETINTQMNQQIHDVKLDAECKAKPHMDRIGKLELYVKEYVEANKAELDGKTRQLNFGKTGFRLSTKLVLRKVETVLAALKSFGMADCITVKETINKDVLRKYKEEDIIKVGGALQKEDTFWYETEREKLRASL